MTAIASVVEIIEKQEALLGLRVFTIMHQRQLSMRQLAKAAHVPLSTLQKILKGEGKQPSVWTILGIAQALDVSIDYLVGRKEDGHA